MKIRAPVVCVSGILLLFAVVCYLIYSTGKKAPSQDPQKRFNVVLIVSDALRQDVLGCYGGEARTPNIDWLAENGVLFENAYSTSPWTVPSVVSMFTGNYATSYGYSRYSKTMRVLVPTSELQLVEFLKQSGYITKMLIENVQALIHNNFQGFESIQQAGHSDISMPTPMRERIENITGGEMYDTPAYKNSFVFLGHLLDIPANECFFILHWIEDPHIPYGPVEKFKSRIEVDKSKLSRHMGYYSNSNRENEELSAEEKKYIKDLYVAEVESVDERVGFVLKMLEHKKLMDNTYIIFTSDHGEQFGEHGLYGHGGFGRGCHYYEGLMRVPLIFSGPKMPKVKRIKDSVSHLDLMPTIKDLLGAGYEDDMQGKSYAKLLFKHSSRKGFLYFDDVREHDQVDALLENNFKLISKGDNKFELYDILNDNREDNNLASSRAPLVASMNRKIKKIREENKQRQKKNVAALTDNMDQLSDIEKKQLIGKLRSLGYIK